MGELIIMGEFVFPNTRSAEQALTDAGFSFGTLQRDDPRGVLYGDFIIEKWRNLSPDDRRDLDGRMTRIANGPDSPVKITITRRVPEGALDSLREAAKALGDAS